MWFTDKGENGKKGNTIACTIVTCSTHQTLNQSVFGFIVGTSRMIKVLTTHHDHTIPILQLWLVVPSGNTRGEYLFQHQLHFSQMVLYLDPMGFYCFQMDLYLAKALLTPEGHTDTCFLWSKVSRHCILYWVDSDLCPADTGLLFSLFHIYYTYTLQPWIVVPFGDLI